MRKTENECVDCGKPCMGRMCPYRNVTRFYCDRCGEEGVLYHWEDEEVCLNCIADDLDKVEESNVY